MPGKEESIASFSGQTEETKGAGGGGLRPPERPELRVVQVEYDSRLGKSVYKDVGAMWRNTSKSGNEFYTMKIGKLKLLAFPNGRDRQLQSSWGDRGQSPLE